GRGEAQPAAGRFRDGGRPRSGPRGRPGGRGTGRAATCWPRRPSAPRTGQGRRTGAPRSPGPAVLQQLSPAHVDRRGRPRRAAAGQAAAQRFEALEADLAGARAAESQSRARVEELAARSQQAPVAAVAEADRTAVEVYLLSRIAAQRDVGQAGSLPLVVDDA